MRKLTLAVAGLGLLLAAAPAVAHHAFAAEFDANKPVNFKGTVTKMEWTNPHTWLHVDVKQPDGTAVNWAIEAGTPNVLFRRGFTKDSLVPGTVGTSARRANCFPAVFDPIVSMASGGGPMNVIPASAQARGNAGFSARNPYPGCSASQPARRATSISLSMQR